MRATIACMPRLMPGSFLSDSGFDGEGHFTVAVFVFVASSGSYCKLAVSLHAVVGGTPAYRRFVHDDSPEGADDFDDWLRRTVLDPSTPLFREAHCPPVLHPGMGRTHRRPVQRAFLR